MARNAPPSAGSSARSAARSMRDSRPFRALARAGFVANGVVHALLGVLVLVVSFGGSGQTDQAGAFQTVASAPLGAALLWVIAGALAALGLWHAVNAFLTRGAAGGGERARAVAGEVARAVVFFVLAGVGASVALGGRPQSEQSAESSSGSILSLPGGPFVLCAIGLGVCAVGVGFVVSGVARRFRKKLALPSGAAGSAVVALGVAGYMAKGVALGIVGVLLLTAAVTLDPTAAGGLDGAIRALLAVPAGPLLGAAVGVGLIAYGAFTVLRVRYARLES